jgi:hypothetical protein
VENNVVFTEAQITRQLKANVKQYGDWYYWDGLWFHEREWKDIVKWCKGDLD